MNVTKIFIVALGALIVLCATEPTWASAATGGGLPYEGWLTKLRASITGPVAYSFALIGIVVAGAVLIFGGEINAFMRTLVFLVLVMALIIGANAVMSDLFGTGALIAT